jgi:hypothetical protein
MLTKKNLETAKELIAQLTTLGQLIETIQPGYNQKELEFLRNCIATEIKVVLDEVNQGPWESPSNEYRGRSKIKESGGTLNKWVIIIKNNKPKFIPWEVFSSVQLKQVQESYRENKYLLPLTEFKKALLKLIDEIQNGQLDHNLLQLTDELIFETIKTTTKNLIEKIESQKD